MIRKICVNSAITQEQLAFKLNISHVHMNRMEKGKEGCSIDLLLEIAELFAVSTDYLLTGKLSSAVEVKDDLQDVMDSLEEIIRKISG